MANLRPGQAVKISGQYEIIGPRGGETGKERTLVKGEPAPPTPKSNETFKTFPSIVEIAQ